MKNVSTLLLSLLILVSINAFAQEYSEKRPPKEKWSLVEMSGAVIEINAETREITVKGEFGNLETFTAGDGIKRFDEVKVGDVITFEFYNYISAEFRHPTTEELETPLVVLAEGIKAPDDMDPAAILGAVVKAVVIVEAINISEMLVTVKGPRGNYVSIPVEDTTLIEQLQVGEIVILTYAEAVALSLDKIK